MTQPNPQLRVAILTLLKAWRLYSPAPGMTLIEYRDAMGGALAAVEDELDRLARQRQPIETEKAARA